MTYGNVQLRMSTTLSSELETVFDNNLSDDATVVYEGPLTVSTQASGPPEGPRGFAYRYDFEAPFFYDPSAGNLVFDVITSSGYTPSQREDQHSGGVSMFGGPGDTEGGPLAFGLVVQFSFVPARVIPGDFNEDGVLDLTDFGILAANFNQSFDVTESFSRGDINLDRRVDLRDFLGFRQIFNDRAVAAVPEPSSVMLGFLVLGAMVVCLYRGRLAISVAGAPTAG